ncbi:MAG: thiamine-phosphate kinase [Deltaproteobacteria bacterium]|nr:MAG: thiamine-phosphate kinase [Deltaproteobacteria bacterium]
MDERERIELLRGVLERAAVAGGHGAETVIGIGDDAAVLEVAGARLAWSVDVAVEDVHFRRDWLSFNELGYKAAMAALSDLAAMAARPCGVLSSLVLPEDLSDGQLAELAAGQAAACQELGTQVIGGNLSRGSGLSITTAVLGVVGDQVLRRDGARAGDQLYLGGAVGLAAAGLVALEAGSDQSDGALAPALAAWRQPKALLASALAVAPVARAGIDVSDGLALDAARLCEAGGLKVVLDPSRLVSEALARAAAALDRSPLELALHGGEDYALLVAAPAGCQVVGLAPVGRFEAAGPGEGMVWLQRGAAREAVSVRGFDHFASNR